MEFDASQLNVNDRVRALRRPNFPEGVIVEILQDGFVLVRWDGNLLETAHRSDLERLDSTSR